MQALNPTREVTHEDIAHHPGDDYLPCESKPPNIHPSGTLQTGLSGSTENDDRSCEKRIEECTNQSTRAVASEHANSLEISQQSIHIEQAKDPILQLILHWKRSVK